MVPSLLLIGGLLLALLLLLILAGWRDSIISHGQFASVVPMPVPVPYRGLGPSALLY